MFTDKCTTFHVSSPTGEGFTLDLLAGYCKEGTAWIMDVPGHYILIGEKLKIPRQAETRRAMYVPSSVTGKSGIDETFPEGKP